jgi:hypothetical protein
MRTKHDVESYLLGSSYQHDEIADGTYRVVDPQRPAVGVIVRVESEIVVFRLKVLGLEQVKQREELFKRLLELNAADMVHAAYGITDNAIVMDCALRLETLDLGELRGTLDDFMLALERHRAIVRQYC